MKYTQATRKRLEEDGYRAYTQGRLRAPVVDPLFEVQHRRAAEKMVAAWLRGWDKAAAHAAALAGVRSV